MKRIQRFKTALLATCLTIGMAGCSSTGPVLTTPGNPVPVAALFPPALLAEPIQFHAGYTHLTQPFRITSPDTVWEVSVGFVRRDDRMPVKHFVCLVDPRKSPFREIRKCTNDEPGVHMKWELIHEDGTVTPGLTYDALKEDTNTQSGRTFWLLGLGAFANQPAGQYRIKVTVLRDFPELDITDPRIVIGKPFFRRR